MNNLTTIANRLTATKKFTLLVVGLFLAVAAPFFAANQASAVGGCGTNQMCLYQHSNFGGTAAGSTLGVGCYNIGPSLNNQVSSVVNNTIFHVTYYDSANCTNPCFFSDPGKSYRANLALDRYDFPCNLSSPNDNLSSFRLY